jgi:hypothetical protein
MYMYVYNLLVEVRDGNIVSEDETPILRHARLRYLVYVCGGGGGRGGQVRSKIDRARLKKFVARLIKKKENENEKR